MKQRPEASMMHVGRGGVFISVTMTKVELQPVHLRFQRKWGIRSESLNSPRLAVRKFRQSDDVAFEAS